MLMIVQLKKSRGHIMVNMSYQAIEQPCFQKLFGNVNDYKVSKFEACYKEYFGLQYSAFYLFVQA